MLQNQEALVRMSYTFRFLSKLTYRLLRLTGGCGRIERLGMRRIISVLAVMVLVFTVMAGPAFAQGSATDECALWFVNYEHADGSQYKRGYIAAFCVAR